MHYLVVLLFYMISGFNKSDIQDEDGSLWGGSDEELDKTSDLDREWKRRHDQFHTVLTIQNFLFPLFV